MRTIPPYYVHVHVNQSLVIELDSEEIIFGLCFVEVLIILATAIAIPPSCWIVNKSNILHPNLCAIYSAVLYQYYISMISRLYMLAAQCYIIGPREFGCLWCVAAERIISIFRRLTYETEERYRVRIILIGLNTIGTLFTSYLVCAKYLTILEGLWFALIANLLAILFILFVFWRNYVIKCKVSSLTTKTYSLSGRYQLNENHEAVKTLLVLAISSALCNTVVGVFFLLGVYFDRSSLFSAIFYELYDILIAIYVLVIAILMAIICLPAKRRQFPCCKSRESTIPRIEITQLSDNGQAIAYITNRRGNTLYLGASQDDYFSQFRKVW